MEVNLLPFHIAIYRRFRVNAGKFQIESVPEYFYSDYLNCFEKHSDKGCISIETEDSVCSYYIKNSDNGVIKTCCIIPPYTYTNIDVYENEELFFYKYGVVNIYKDKFITKNMSNINKKVLSICIGLLFFIPIIITVILNLKGYNFRGFEGLFIYLCFLAIIYFIDYHGRKSLKLEEKHKKYIEGYCQGLNNEHQYNEFINNLEKVKNSK